MAIWPFDRKRKQQPKDVPEEVQEYYQSERRERVGIAWLLALATLVTTIILAIGLYYGGRWAWDKTFGKDEQKTSTEQPTEQPQSVDNENEQDQGSEQTNQPSQAQDQPAQPQQSQPSTTPQTTAPSNLTKTGPADTLAAFVGASIVGTVAYQVYIRRRLTD